ncbi:NADPH dehydrogenase afvA [Ceratocystis fimbriata CBS 114723]|uniref:NADPH dehydrogenase afvA n=1 Tax=Ceratocystis fimbriata CBS 114723 TaxID=1035309 RepID=A0A2C5W2A0_9PEZI|nr:NADPH dehydrogenase afvA [Ceratocystis fimbriata CBS 114723]
MSFPTKTPNTPAKGVPYYTPAQSPPAGSASEDQGNVPTLFKPLAIRDITLHNRIAVSPMCTYSAYDGIATDFHLVHAGQFALHGASLVMVEATAVQPRGRITAECLGLWKDEQIAPLKKITDFIRSQGSVSAIQLAHSGRKGSTLATWVATKRKEVALESEGGWPDDLISASAIPWDEGFPTPRAASEEDLKQLVDDFKSAAVRAVQAGFDIIEIHSAHGYLLCQFLSPVTNQRSDKYGGSYENRTRLLKEVITATRSVIPANMPLFVRISATEWLEHTGQPSWDVASSIRLAKELPALGVDLLDVSSGANSPAQQIPRNQKLYQLDIAGQIRAALHEDGLKLLVGGVGMIRDAEIAKAVVQDGTETVAPEYGQTTRADLAFVARQFLKDPAFVLNIARDLGVEAKFPHQYWQVAPKVYREVIRQKA